MSGIAGVVRVDEGSVDEASLARMLERMAHRGPDGSGQWVRGRVGLGHQALRTTPESRNEALPFRDDARRLVLTADAKIDNRDELIVELGLAERDIPDSRLIAAAYRHWGRQCLDRLEGSFAFAIWDERDQVLFCARDHFGVRPFHYHWLPGRRLAFASDIRSLLALSDTPRRLDESRVADFLLDFEHDRTATYYRDILRLPPSHWLEVRDGRLAVTCYWSPESIGERRLGSDREYANAFRERFESAVRKDLRTSRPLTVALSGGIDSSSVACVGRKLLADRDEGPLRCDCIEYDTAPGGDERAYFNAVVEQGGMLPHYFKAERVKPLDHWMPLLECYDGPIDNPHFGLGWSVWQDMRQRGFQVVLDGIDGDVTVSYGFVYLQELARSGAWLTLFREALGLTRNFLDGDASPFSVVWKHGLRPLLPWQGKPRHGFVNEPIVRPDFARRMDFAERIDRLERHERSLRTSKAYHCDEIVHGIVVGSLEKTNKLSSAFGIEPRHPFFDKRLIEFCVSLPREQRIRDGWTRAIVRRALSDLLPEKVLYRGGKWAPTSYFAPRLLRLDRDRLREALDTYLPAADPYLDTGKVRAIFYRSAAEPTTEDAFRLWNAANLGAWLQVSGVGV